MAKTASILLFSIPMGILIGAHLGRTGRNCVCFQFFQGESCRFNGFFSADSAASSAGFFMVNVL
jgi:hypothetical protein